MNFGSFSSRGFVPDERTGLLLVQRTSLSLLQTDELLQSFIQAVYAIYRESLSVCVFIRDFIATKVRKSKLCKYFQFSYFYMISTCCLHNFLTKSYRYEIFKNTRTRQLRVYRLFGKTKNYLNCI